MGRFTYNVLPTIDAAFLSFELSLCTKEFEFVGAADGNIYLESVAVSTRCVARKSATHSRMAWPLVQEILKNTKTKCFPM